MNKVRALIGLNKIAEKVESVVDETIEELVKKNCPKSVWEGAETPQEVKEKIESAGFNVIFGRVHYFHWVIALYYKGSFVAGNRVYVDSSEEAIIVTDIYPDELQDALKTKSPSSI